MVRVSAKALDKEAAMNLLQSEIYLNIFYCLQDKPTTIRSSEHPQKAHKKHMP